MNLTRRCEGVVKDIYNGSIPLIFFDHAILGFHDTSIASSKMVVRRDFLNHLIW